MTQPELPKLATPDVGRGFNFKTDTSWGIRDPVRFKQLMDEATSLVEAGWYMSDNLFAWMRNNSALEDGPFMRAWQSNLMNAADQAVLWRRYILCCAAYHCVQLDGDFVECGVLLGTGVKTVIDFFGKDHFPKQFWAYDTFDSNPVEGHNFTLEGQRPGLFEQVQARFAGYDNVRLVRGLLPECLEGNSPERIAYLHLDMNQAEFEIAVLDRLFERMVPGGVLILDDYEWSSAYREQKIKEDVWFEARQYRVFPLPTGQGLVLKR
jgi:O-methyltransferase